MVIGPENSITMENLSSMQLVLLPSQQYLTLTSGYLSRVSIRLVFWMRWNSTTHIYPKIITRPSIGMIGMRQIRFSIIIIPTNTILLMISRTGMIQTYPKIIMNPSIGMIGMKLTRFSIIIIPTNTILLMISRTGMIQNSIMTITSRIQLRMVIRFLSSTH